MPIRIYDIAKRLNIESKEVLAKAKELGISAARVPSSALDKITAEYLEGHFKQADRGEAVLQEHACTTAHPATENAGEETGAQTEEDARTQSDSNTESRVVRRVLIPLRNCDQNFFEVSPLFLDNDVRVQEICDEDYATLHREEEDVFVPIVRPNSQCVIVDLQHQDADQSAYEAVAKVQFVFKTFSKSPLILSHAAVVSATEGERAIIEKTLILPVWGDYAQFMEAPFDFDDDTSAEKVTKFFQLVKIAIAKHPGLLITLSRFNSCWLRSTDHDRVIDIAVSLESLLSSVTEIKFKFALFNAFITHSVPSEREKAFELLQLLYDARSSIVHGDSKSSSNKRKIQQVLNSMGEVLRIAQAAISYYIFYLCCRETNAWQAHLEKLVLGTDKRISPEDTN